MRTSFLALLCLASCGPAARPVTTPATPATPASRPLPPQVTAKAPPPALAVRLATDTQLETPSGGRLTGPEGWFLTRRAELLLLEGPERDLSVAVVERKEREAKAAITAAWTLLQPGFARPVRQATELPAREGWDAVTQIVYEMPVRERRTAVALAQRKGPIWYVALIDGATAALERRGGALQVCVGSLRAPGVEEESFRGKKAHVLDAARLRAFEAFAEAARQKLGIPGVALALVQGGKVIYEKGLGVRELGKPAPVTPKTLFLIGSITKSMTSLMMAALVDRGKLTWETPVAPLLPGFSLGDPEATRKLTLRHTVCACTGLPRQDMEMLFEYRGVTPEQRLEELRSMKPTTAFGEAFQYSNPMVSAGGYVAAHVLHPKQSLGTAYDAAMVELVFRPLGMSTTTFDFKRALRHDHATPHGMTWKLRYQPVAIGCEGWLPAIRPAGGAWSNLRDMSRYVLLHLGKGVTPEGKRVISEENLVRRYQPQARVSKDVSYGLGLGVSRSHGIETISHGGGTAGFATDFFFLPEHGFGAVVLTNGGDNFLSGVLRRKLLELLFDGRDEAQANLDARWKRVEEVVAKEAKKINVSPDPAWLKRVAGDYQNPSLGKVSITLRGEKAVLDVGEWKSTIGQKKELDGTLKVALLDPPWTDFEVLPGVKDGRRTLLVETAQQKYLFVEVASP